MRLIFAAFQLQYPTNLYPLTKDVLDSYANHQGKKDKFTKQLQDLKAVDGTMFLDSGAFGAWSKGEQIDIDKYIEFCLTHQENVTAIANLDVIPGSWGVIPSAAEVEESAKKGWENYQYLLKRGIDREKLVHVFHQGERFYWLDKLAEECPYFGISPANDRTTQQKVAWLEQAMRHALDKDGVPKGKFHGFGVTSLDIMRRYPWWTCDSTSWLRPGGYGAVVIPKFRDNVPIYDETPNIISVSERSPNMRTEGKHLLTLTQREQECILNFISQEGFEIETLMEKHVERHKLSILVIKRVIATIKEWPWAYRTAQPAFI